MIVATGDRLVKSVAVIHTNQTQHREEYADTTTDRTFEVEWVEIAKLRPRITGIGKGKDIDGGGRLQHQRVAQLH